jgi:hypothetical protein
MKLSDMKVASHAAKIAAAENTVQKAAAVAKITEKFASAQALADRIGRLTKTGGLDSMTKLSRQLAEQQKTLDAFARPKYLEAFDAVAATPKMPEYMTRELPSIPQIHIPPNPIHETNRRLATIEDQFDKMQEIAAQGAQIATSLQVSAAEFLTKFDDVATKNDKTAGRAVKIAIAAAIMAAVVPIGQTLYSEIWKARSDAAEMQKIVSELKSELGTLRDAQKHTAERLGEVIGVSNSDIATTLREVRDAIARSTPAPPISGKSLPDSP